MAMDDLNLPLLPSAEQIRRREFATVRRGYDPDQVRDYLLSVARQVETLEKEVREIRKAGSAPAVESMVAPAPEGDPYEQVAKRFAEVLGTADRESSRIVNDARLESSQVLERARTEADRIRVDAQAKAEGARLEGNEVLSQAKAEADRILSGLGDRRRALLAQLKDMRARLLTVAAELRLDDEMPEPMEADARMGMQTGAGTLSGMPADDADAEADRSGSVWISRPSTVEIPDLTEAEGSGQDQKD